MLNTRYDSIEPPEIRVETDGPGAAFYLGCADVGVAYEELTGRGMKADPPAMAPYGLRLFSVKDPDGYTLVFQEVR